MKYLFRKMRRDLIKLFPQFIAVFLMAFIGVLLYTGVEGTWHGMSKGMEKYLNFTNISDAWVYSKNITQKEFEQIKSLKGVKDIDKSMVVTAQMYDEKSKEQLVIPDLRIMTINVDSMTKFELIKGSGFSDNMGVWLDADFAKEHNLEVNDFLAVKVNQINANVKIIGLILHPEYIYYTTSNDEVMPDHFNHGYCLISESYAKKIFGGIAFNKITLKIDNEINESLLKESVQEILKESYLGYVSQKDFQPLKAPKNKVAQIRKISIMFSSIFLLLALLTIQTTMRRLVENQRSQIGTLKALGFHDRIILLHYSLYGFIVTLVGSFLGLILGPRLLSPVFLDAQTKSYSIPNLKSEITLISFAVVAFVTISCTIATILSCRNRLNGMPADTMRGSAPKSGKKMFIEGLPKVWSKISFDWKWSLRDIARNKIRTIMGMVGVVGCMVLIIASLGLQDSANNANLYLYGKQFTYDAKISLSSALAEKELDELKDLNNASDLQFIQENTIEFNYNGKKSTGMIMILDEGNYVNIKNTHNKYIKLPDEGVILSHKMAVKLGVNKGDFIEIRHNQKKDSIGVLVVDVAKVPAPQGVILSKDAWEKLGFNFIPTAIFTKNLVKQGVLNKLNQTTKVISLDLQLDSVKKLMNSFKMIFAMLIAAAVLLGVVILYNLGLLSYTERIREYATLKVLGFHQKEITLFAFRESILTTIVGWIIAIPISFIFLNFYVNVVSVDAFEWFSELRIISFIIATIVTIGCSVSISYILSRKVKKINMIEALKSVE